MSMILVPEESLQVHRVVVSAMSRHTFALVGPSKRGVENQELATGVGVKWKDAYLILTAGHVVDYCSEDTLRFFFPARYIDFPSQDPRTALGIGLRPLFELRQPKPPVFADYPIDLAAIVLPPQPGAEDRFAILDECATMPANGAQVGVLGYPGACKIAVGKNYMASPEHFFDSLDLAGAACQHEPRQDFTVPYRMAHRANGYSGSGVWHFPTEPLWSPEPRLCGLVATECTIDKAVSGFRIETVLNFLRDQERLLRS